MRLPKSSLTLAAALAAALSLAVPGMAEAAGKVGKLQRANTNWCIGFVSWSGGPWYARFQPCNSNLAWRFKAVQDGGTYQVKIKTEDESACLRSNGRDHTVTLTSDCRPGDPATTWKLSRPLSGYLFKPLNALSAYLAGDYDSADEYVYTATTLPNGQPISPFSYYVTWSFVD